MLRAMGLAAEPTDGTWGPVGDYQANVQPPARKNAGDLSLNRALSLPAVFRAIQLTAGMAAQLTLEAWRGTELLQDRAIPSLIVQPDPWRPLDSWVERFVVNLATDGNNFLRITRMPGGPSAPVAALEVLDPFRVTVVRKRVGNSIVKSYVYASEVGRIDLKADEVIHTWGLEVPGMTRGLGPIAACRLALTGVLDVREYSDRWFREEAVDGTLTTDQRIDRTAARAARELWYDRDPNDPNGPRLRVMGQGLKYDPIMLKPEDAQWIQAQNFGILDVARMFGVPADYLIAAVEGNSLTYSNLEMIDAQFLRTTLFPTYLRKIENALTSALVRGQRARFRTAELLRPDAKTRAEIDQIYMSGTTPVYDGDYVRQREGIPGPAPKPRAVAPAPAEQENAQ